MTLNHQSREAMRSGARKGRAKQARMAREWRCAMVRKALRDSDRLMNVRELAIATGRSDSVIRAALAEMDTVEKIGTQYRLKADLTDDQQTLIDRALEARHRWARGFIYTSGEDDATARELEALGLGNVGSNGFLATFTLSGEGVEAASS